MAAWILYDPLAGGDCREAAEAPEVVIDEEVTLYDITKVTNYAAFLSELTAQDRLVIVGGDGTLHRFANDTAHLTVEDILSLTALGGVYAEESYALMPIDDLTPADVAEYIRGVGAAHTIMTTDLGQKARMSSGEGMALFASLMEAEGISKDDLHTMMVTNPRKLLGL